MFFGPRLCESERASAIDKAARLGRTEELSELLYQGAYINGSWFSRPPLPPAIRSGNLETIRVLLEHGAHPDGDPKSIGLYPLGDAIAKDSIPIVDLLLEFGADINVKQLIQSPLMKCASYGSEEMLLHLLCCGADIHAETETGMTALTYAIRWDRPDMGRLLLENGAIFSLLDAIAMGATTLYKKLKAEKQPVWGVMWGAEIMYLAIEKRDTKMVSFLLDEVGDLDKRLKMGARALMRASYKNYTEIVALLLEQGANPNLRAWDGSTALQTATEQGNEEMVRLLEKYGAKRWLIPLWLLPLGKRRQQTI